MEMYIFRVYLSSGNDVGIWYDLTTLFDITIIKKTNWGFEWLSPDRSVWVLWVFYIPKRNINYFSRPFSKEIFSDIIKDLKYLIFPKYISEKKKNNLEVYLNELKIESFLISFF